MTAPADTCPVAVTVLGVERVTGRGSLVALAIVELDLFGVVVTLQGVQVHRRPVGGSVEVRSPVWRHPRTGAWLPGVLLPPELADALTGQVIEALGTPVTALQLQGAA